MVQSVVYLVAVCVLVPVMSAPTGSTTDSKDICHGLECPKYTVLNKTSDWELRRYSATKWMATSGTAMSKDAISRDMFYKLFRYISGDNVNKTKIDMTAPVLTKNIHGAGPNCESDFVMYFMLPFQFWDAPIEPIDPKVSIAQTPTMDVFVRSFGGFAKDQDYIDNVAQLVESLPKDASVEDKFFFSAGYDGPYTFKDRHNEVWLLKL